jgi:hypothetical protein
MKRAADVVEDRSVKKGVAALTPPPDDAERSLVPVVEYTESSSALASNPTRRKNVNYLLIAKHAKFELYGPIPGAANVLSRMRSSISRMAYYNPKKKAGAIRAACSTGIYIFPEIVRLFAAPEGRCEGDEKEAFDRARVVVALFDIGVARGAVYVDKQARTLAIFGHHPAKACEYYMVQQTVAEYLDWYGGIGPTPTTFEAAFLSRLPLEVDDPLDALDVGLFVFLVAFVAYNPNDGVSSEYFLSVVEHCRSRLAADAAKTETKLDRLERSVALCADGGVLYAFRRLDAI